MSYTPNIVDFHNEIPRLNITDYRGGVILRSPNWLGDVMMCLPATWQLRRCLPAGTPLWVLAPAGLAPLWEAAPWLDGVCAFKGHHPNAGELAKVRAMDFGLGIVFPNSFSSAWDLWRAGIPRRLGRSGNLRGLLLTDRIRKWNRDEGTGRWHQLSYYLELVSAVGDVEYTAERPALEIAEEPAAARGITKGLQWMVIAPGANYGPAKQWPIEYYAEVAREWQKHRGRVLLVGTKREKAVSRLLANQVQGVFDITGETTLTELMSLLANADIVVANDSGSMHLAAGCGTPGVALFASTDPIGTGPLGAPWETITAEVSCRPCFQRQCPWEGKHKYQCMQALPPQAVIEKLGLRG